MSSKMYTVEETAEILSIHPKTVQRFLREGKIMGQKIGREWRISQEALREYTHGELADPSPAEGSYRSFAVSTESLKSETTVSTVVEIPEISEDETSRLSNSMVALLNCKDPAWGAARFSSDYNRENRKGRFIFYGSVTFMVSILEIFKQLQNNSEGGNNE